MTLSLSLSLSLSFVLSSSLHSPWVCLSGWQLHSALLSRPLNQSGPELPPTTAHFPHCPSKGLREAESRARPMREQRRWESTNERRASWDAPAELAARHHFENQRPPLPPLHRGAGELPGGKSPSPSAKGGFSAIHQPLLNASSPALFQRTFLAFKRFPN